MQKIKKVCLVSFFAALFFVVSGNSADAATLGPQAGNCSWGDYSDTSKIYVSTDGSSAYNCPSGSTNCHTVINNAIAAAPSGGSVYLKDGTYIINGTIQLKSNITLEGDQNTTVKLKDHAGWTATWVSEKAGSIQYPLIGSSSSVSNVEIKCFSIDGNYNFSNGNFSPSTVSCWSDMRWNYNFSTCEALGPDRYHGLGYYTMIRFSNPTGIYIHDMNMQDGVNDAIQVIGGKTIRIYNNKIYRPGHEGFYGISVNDIEIYNNEVGIRTNSAFRTDDCYNVIIHDNSMSAFDNWAAGIAGIQIAKKTPSKVVSNIQVYRNVIYETWGNGIWLNNVSGSTSGISSISVHNNVFLRTGMTDGDNIPYAAGITVANFVDSTIENNVFDSVYHDAIYMTSGNIVLRNNIIVNTQKHRGLNNGGYGIEIKGGTIISQNNCFYQNTSGSYSGTVSSKVGDFYADPLFADWSNNDYHLISMAGRWDPDVSSWVVDSDNSPCIDVGLPSSDYSNEPDPNGGVINIGCYGNTTQASLSGNTPPSEWPDDPIEDSFDAGYTSTSPEPTTGGSTINYSTSFISSLPSLFSGIFSSPGVSVYSLNLFDPLGSAPATATQECTDVPGSAGLIPCGKSIDDPETGDWDECDPCDFCAMVLMGQLVVEFLLKLAVVAATLALAFAGFVYVFAAGKAEMVNKSKLMMKAALIGFIIIFISWVLVDSILTTLGYIDPVEGVWYTIC